MVRLRSGARTRASDAEKPEKEEKPDAPEVGVTSRRKARISKSHGQDDAHLHAESDYESPGVTVAGAQRVPRETSSGRTAKKQREEADGLENGGNNDTEQRKNVHTEEAVQERKPRKIKQRSTEMDGPLFRDSTVEMNGVSEEKDHSSQEASARKTFVHRCAFVDFKPESIESLAGHRNLMAVGRASGEVELWERCANALHQKLVVPGTRSQGLRALVWQGERLFGANLDGTIFEINFQYRTQITNEPAGGGGIWAIDSNGEFLATACEDGKVRLYVAKTLGQGVDFDRAFSGSSNGRLLCIRFHGADPNNFLFTSGVDGIIRKWSVTSRRVVEQIQVPSLSRSLKVWSLDTHGEAIACGDSLGRVHVWSHSEIGTPQTFSEHRADVLSVKFSADGQALFASGVDSRVASFRVAHGSWVYTYSHRAHTHDVRAQSVFNSDGDEVLCSGGIDTQLVWYPTRSFDRVRPRKESPFRQRQCVFATVSAEKENTRLLLIMQTFRLELWHLNMESKQHSHLASVNFDDDVTIRCAAMSNGGRFIACGDDVRGLSVFKVEINDFSKSGDDGDVEDEVAEVILNKVHPAIGKVVPLSIAFGASDATLVLATHDRLLIVDLESLALTKAFAFQHGPLISLCSSLDGQWVAGVCASEASKDPDGIEIFNLDALRHHSSLPGSLFGPSSHAAFSFSPDSAELLLARSNGTIFGFSVEERKLFDWTMQIQSQYSERIIGLAFNPACKTEIVAWSWATIVVLDRAHPERPVRVQSKFKPLMHVTFLKENNLFLLESPFANLRKHLPDVLERDRFGT